MTMSVSGLSEKELYKKQIRELEEAIEEDRKQILKILKK